jgi:F-type H+-transporting ATPase subunit b
MQNVARAIEEFVNNALSVSLLDMAIQIGATLVLFFVVKYFFWNHVTAFLDKRKEVMNEEFTSAEKANAEAIALREEAEEKLQEIRLSAKQIYEEAKERGEQERKRIVNDAKEQAQRILVQTQQEIEREWENAKAQMNNEIVEVASLLASKALKEEMNTKTQQRLVRQITKEVQDA